MMSGALKLSPLKEGASNWDAIPVETPFSVNDTPNRCTAPPEIGG